MATDAYSRTLLVLLRGPGSERVVDTTEVELSKASSSGKATVPVSRTLWSYCVEGALEYARVIYELQPRGAAVSMMLVGNGARGGKAVRANGWGLKDQNMGLLQASLERLQGSSAAINGSAAAEEAARVLLEDLPIKGVDGRGRGLGREGCTAVVVCNPECVGASEVSLAVEEEHFKEAFRKEIARQGMAGSLDVNLEVIWVGGDSKDGGGGGAGGVKGLAVGSLPLVAPAAVKGRLSRMLAAHFHLQLVTVTGIPMKDGEKGKEGGKDKDGEKAKDGQSAGEKARQSHMYDVDLLGCAELGEAPQLLLEWQALKQLEKHININNFASRSIKKATALRVSAKPTQTLLKHLKLKPATLWLGGAASSPALPSFSGPFSKIPTRLWVLRDLDGSLFLHEVLLGGIIETFGPPQSLPDYTALLEPPDKDDAAVTAFLDRFRQMVKASALPVDAASQKDKDGGGEGLTDVTMASPVAHITTAAIERRTRYLPLGEGVSPLYSGSGSGERSVRSTQQALQRPNVMGGETTVTKGGEITAPRKMPIRGLKEYMETCLEQDVSEQTVSVAVDTARSVNTWMNQAASAGIVNGWGLHELRALWNEMKSIGSKAALPPAAGSHHRLARYFGVLGVSADAAGGAGAEEEEEDSGLGLKRKGGAVAGAPPAKQTRARRTHDIPLDQHGRPVMPLQLGQAITILSLGKVKNDNPNFHTEKYIWPVGYKCKRQYASTVEVDRKCDYLCEITDGGAKPLFRITPSDAPENREDGLSASGVWSAIMKKVNNRRQAKGLLESKTAVSGPEYYGLAYPEVRRLIQELPGARMCATQPLGQGCYKWQHFGDALDLKGGEGEGESRGRAGDDVPATEEERAWMEMEAAERARQSGGREAVGIDNPELYNPSAHNGDGGESLDALLGDYNPDSVFRVYWQSYLSQPSKIAPKLERFYDPSRHTVRD